MIIGNGLIGSLFNDCDQDHVIFFASGVSNSLEQRKEEFLREENLIRKTIASNPEKVFVYFSTCSIYDSTKTGSPYVLHKLKMEQLIANACDKYMILRVSNAVGKGGNPNLLLNYLVRSAANSNTITVHTKAKRNLIDVEDIKNITLDLLDLQRYNKVINIAYICNYSIIEILEAIEQQINIPLKLDLVKSGSGYDIDISEVENYFKDRNMIQKEVYLSKIIKKYYIKPNDDWQI